MPWKLLRLAEMGSVELCMASSMLTELAKCSPTHGFSLDWSNWD